jgi:hypothetical protein
MTPVRQLICSRPSAEIGTASARRITPECQHRETGDEEVSASMLFFIGEARRLSKAREADQRLETAALGLATG